MYVLVYLLFIPFINTAGLDIVRSISVIFRIFPGNVAICINRVLKL